MYEWLMDSFPTSVDTKLLMSMDKVVESMPSTARAEHHQSDRHGCPTDGHRWRCICPFESPKQHQTETDRYKMAVNGCRQPSIVLTSTKIMNI